MKVVWVNRSFLDYRVPVYVELNRLLNGKLMVIFSANHTPMRVQNKIVEALGGQAMPLRDERVLARKGDMRSDFANTFLEVTYQPNLYKQIGLCNPNLVIGEGFFKWTATALVYHLLNRIPLVISYERTRFTERNAQWYRTLYRKTVIKFVDAICCNGSLSAEYVHSLGIPYKRIFTGSMAADTNGLREKCDAYRYKGCSHLSSDLRIQHPVFLYVGRVVERKGVREFLKGWDLLIRRRPNSIAKLIVVGDGPERGDLQNWVQDRGLRNVRFLGPVDYDDIAKYYAVADVFVMPTLEDNWSLVVPEAMSCGLPILCSIYNGCWPELVHENINGFTLDPRNAEDIANKLEVFLDHPEIVKPMGEASKQIVKQFSPQNAAEAIYQACLLALNKQKS
jgi:glycosyltransferase involved in cell wall biosynthesis